MIEVESRFHLAEKGRQWIARHAGKSSRRLWFAWLSGKYAPAPSSSMKRGAKLKVKSYRIGIRLSQKYLKTVLLLHFIAGCELQVPRARKLAPNSLSRILFRSKATPNPLASPGHAPNCPRQCPETQNQ